MPLGACEERHCCTEDECEDDENSNGAESRSMRIGVKRSQFVHDHNRDDEKNENHGRDEEIDEDLDSRW